MLRPTEHSQIQAWVEAGNRQMHRDATWLFFVCGQAPRPQISEELVLIRELFYELCGFFRHTANIVCIFSG